MNFSNDNTQVLKQRSNKERKLLQPSKVSLPSEVKPIQLKKKFNLKKIQDQYKFSKSEEKIDKAARPKTEPNTPKKTETREDREDFDLHLDIKALSMESLGPGGLSKYCRTRRLKSTHSRSMERIWLPGKSTKSTSFNSLCSRKFSQNEEFTERSVGNYYYTHLISSNTCRHGRRNK